jgi:hypothetical protein
VLDDLERSAAALVDAGAPRLIVRSSIASGDRIS